MNQNFMQPQTQSQVRPQYYYQNPQMMNYSNNNQSQMQLGLKGRPVSSIEEVKASVVDFDGSINYFPDLANDRIFTKQINVDGTSSIFMYEKKPIPQQTSNINMSDFITKDELEEILNNFRDSFNNNNNVQQTSKGYF